MCACMLIGLNVFPFKINSVPSRNVAGLETMLAEDSCFKVLVSIIKSCSSAIAPQLLTKRLHLLEICAWCLNYYTTR